MLKTSPSLPWKPVQREVRTVRTLVEMLTIEWMEAQRIIDRSMEDIRSDLADYIAEYDCEILVEDASDSLYFVHFVERTPFWLFPDDVLVSIEQIDEDTNNIELHSQSRLGLGDMGESGAIGANLRSTCRLNQLHPIRTDNRSHR